jgi:hypothetical protein
VGNAVLGDGVMSYLGEYETVIGHLGLGVRSVISA